LATLSNKKIDKSIRIRTISVIVVIILDILLLPWIIKFPSFFVKDFVNAPTLWFNYGLVRAIKDLFSQPDYLKLFLFLQLPVSAFIIWITWNVDRLKKKNRIKDGIGGPEPAGTGQHGTSRWQNKNEMDETVNVWSTEMPLNNKGGIVFGMEKSKAGKEKVWLNKEDRHTLILGATRSGKDRKILMPTIWELAKAGESMIIGDPKGESYITTRDYLQSKGYKVIALNLRDPALGNQWNMLNLVNKAVDNNDIAKASELAWNISNIIGKQNFGKGDQPIWQNGQESALAALILLTAFNSEFKFQRHMATVYHLLALYGQPVITPNGFEFVPLLEYMNRLPIKHPAKAAFAVASIAPYKMRASFFTTVLSSLRLFTDPNIADMTAKQDHEFADIGIEKTAVFLIIPDEISTRDVLATLYIDQVYQSLVELANQRGGRIPRRVNIILNEFGNLPPIPDFDKKLTVAGGRGIRFTLAVQDITQIKKLYKENAQTITGNCHDWIYLKTADVDTAKLISEKTGKYTVETENASSSIQSKGHSMSHGVGLAQRALLLPDEVLRWNINESLVLPISEFPARYPLPDLSLWSANSDLGFSSTGDKDVDMENARQILERRWEQTPRRILEDVKIWMPDMGESSDSEGGEFIRSNDDGTQLSLDNEMNESDEYEKDFL
jgi:type IV secretion system protein VirD4